MSSLSQLIHGILETYKNKNNELDYDKIVTLATFGLIILSSTDNTFVDKIRQQIDSMQSNIMADYYLYDKLEPYLIRRGNNDKDIPLIEVIYEFGTEMGNTQIDFSNAYKTALTQTSLFDAFNSIARVLYQSVFCCKLVEIKDINTKRSLRSNTEPLKSYLAGILKIIDKGKSKIIPKYRFVYYEHGAQRDDLIYKSKSPIEKALDNTAYIFKESSILPSRDRQGGLFGKTGVFENANSFFIKPFNDTILKDEIKKKTHGLQKQIIIVKNYDESVLVPPPNIETVIISVNPNKVTVNQPGYIKYIIENSVSSPKNIKLSYNGCSLKKYNCNEKDDDIPVYTYDNKNLEHLEETIEHVVLNEVNVIINAINDQATAMKAPDFSGVTSTPGVTSALATTSAPGVTSALTPCLIMVYPIAVQSTTGDADGIYDPMPDMKNNITVYRKRTDWTYRIYFEDNYWKIVQNTTSATLVSKCEEPGNQIVPPNTLKNWTDNFEVIDLKTYFKRIKDVNEILYGLSKMTTVIRQPNKFTPSNSGTISQYEKEGDYINIPKFDDLIPYGFVKITRYVVNPFVYMGAMIYDSETNETWGKGLCTYENGDKYTGEITYTDKNGIEFNGTGIEVKGDRSISNGTWNKSKFISGVYTDVAGIEKNIP